MLTLNILTKERIEQLLALLDAEKINATSAIYQELSNLGYGYAGWGYGVATGETLTGQGALLFMQSVAEKNGITIDFQKVADIRIGMLEGYLNALITKSNILGFINEDVKFDKTLEFHIQVFEKNGLDISYWTLQTPMAFIDKYLGGKVAQEEAWVGIRETEGTGLDAIFKSLGLVAIVEAISRGIIYLDENGDIVKKIDIDRNPELIMSGNLTKIIISQKDILAANEWSSNVSTWDPLWKFINSDPNTNTVIGDQESVGPDDNIIIVNPITNSDRQNIVFGLGGKDSIYGASARDDLYGGSGSDDLYGKDGKDNLFGGINDDKLYGGNKNDWLDGGEGDDLLDGGEGDDILIDDAGNETYIFNGNFGHDTIYDSDTIGSIKIDGTILTAGSKINDDEWLSSDGIYKISVINDTDGVANFFSLVVTKNNDTANSITIKYWKNGDLGINLSEFGQDKQVDIEGGLYSFGSDGNNIIFDKKYVASFDGNDLISTTLEDDFVFSGNHDDFVNTSAGKDLISSGDGDDIVMAGLGEDTIYGEAGNDLIMSSATLNSSRSDFLVYFDQELTNQLSDEFKSLDFSYDLNRDENNKVEEYYVIDDGITTYNVLPIFRVAFNTPDGLKPIYNLIYGLNLGVGYSGGDIVYGGEGSDTVIGSSDGDYLYGGKEHKNVNGNVEIEDNDVLYSLDGNDFVYGGIGQDIIYGGDGVDHLFGGEDNDDIVGGHDKDIIKGGNGDDTIQGDLNNLIDTSKPPETAKPPSTALYNRFGDDEIYGGKGKDTVWGNLGNDQIFGGEDDDILIGDHNSIAGDLHGNDIIRGDLGKDKIYGDGGKDDLYGGDGDDEISGDNSNLDGQYHRDDVIHGDEGKDLLLGDGGNDTIYGGTEDDEISGDNSTLEGQFHGDDILNGDEGNDTILGNGGKDTIHGGDGNDRIFGDASNLDDQYHGKDTIFGDKGNDVIFGGGKDDVIHGGEGNDYLEGDSKNISGTIHGDDTINGDGGDDVILGNGGNDKIYGGDGDDLLNGDQLDNREIDGNDELYAGRGNDILNGFNGNDVLDGGEGDDLLFGGKGDDTFISNDGNDQLAGGDGDDIYHIRVRDSKVSVLDSSGENHFYIDGNFNFSQIKIHWYSNAVSLRVPTPSLDPEAVLPKFDLTFFDASETQPTQDGGVIKDEYGDSITGGYDQYLHFKLGLGDLYGVNSDENVTFDYVIHLETYLEERAGLSYQEWTGSWHGIQAPYLIFSNGIIDNDNLVYQSSKIGDLVDIGQIRDNVSQHGVYQADVYQLLEGDDEVQGSVERDVIFGGVGDDLINANDGDDEISGDDGDDQLFGGNGSDLIDGGQGDDSISGDQGNDHIFGGNGKDLINAGQGDDELRGGADEDQLNAGEGNDFLYGDSGEDKLYAEAGSDQLFGGDGEDLLDGGEGSDILTGGAGNDLLVGGEGEDEYIFDQDSGFDTINDVDESILRFNGINSQDSSLSIDGNDLTIQLNNNSAITFKDYLINANIKEIHFENEVWTKQNLNKNITINQYGDEQGNTIFGNQNFNNNIYGGSGNDHLYANGLVNYLYGGEGDDSLYVYRDGAGTKSTVSGGIGYDSYSVQFGNDTLILDEDYSGIIKVSSEVYFTLEGYAFIRAPYNSKAELISTDGANSYYRYTLNNTPLLNANYDAVTHTFVLKKNDQTVFALGGLNNLNDLNQYSGFNIQIDGQSVNYTGGTSAHYQGTTFNLIDFISSLTEIKSTYTDQDDIIYGFNNENNRVLAGAGNNIIYLQDGNNTVNAESGDDQIYAGNGNNNITSGSGDDEIIIGSGLNQIFAEAGNDHISIASGQAYGGSGDDIIIAGNAGVYLDGGEGVDHLVGGLGDDTYIVDELDTYEENAIEGGYDTIHIAQSVDLALNNLEAVTLLGNQNLNAYGDDFNNELIGNSGNNHLDGRTGSDYMAGGEGDDYYVVDVTDTITTDEDGNTRIIEGDQVVEDSDAGIDTIERWQDARFIGQDENGNPVLTNNYRLLEDNIENLILKGQAKTAFGNELDNMITSNAQDNYIDGLGGDDTYIYTKGGGTDTYSFYDDLSATNTLQIQGYYSSDVFAQKYGNSVYLSFKGTSDHIWLSNYYVADTTSKTYKMDQIEFDSGTVWTSSDIDTLVNRAANNHAPTVNAVIPTITSNQGTVFSYKFASNVIIDQDTWDYLSYKITLTTKDSNGQYQPIPSWLNFDAATQTLSGTPPSNVTGNLSFFYWGTDMYGLGTGTSFTLKVNPPNQAPTVLNPIADQSVTDAKAFSYTVPSTTFKDLDGDTLTYTATLEDGSPLPAWLTFNASTKVLSGTSPDYAAALNIKITAKDTANQTVSDVFKLTFVVQNLTVNGTSSVDTLYGASGNDTITGLAGIDILYGQSGNDTLNGGTGNDTMYGGKGNDIFVVDSTSDIVNENANEGIDTVQSSITYTLGNNVENLTLTGTTAINGTGNALNNTLLGNSAINTLTGGAGDDYFDGGAGNDKLLGGLGNDVYVVDSTTDTITENTNEGIDTVRSSVTYTLGNNLENLTLTGTTAINATGNALNNTLTGNSGVNILNGGAGNDILDGQGGNDQFTGGTGSDTLIYQLLVASDAAGGNGADSWSDFTVGNVTTNVNADKIDFGDLLINFTGNYSTSSLDPYIKTLVSGSNTQVYIDRDGSGTSYNSTLLLTLNSVNTNLNDLLNNQQVVV